MSEVLFSRKSVLTVFAMTTAMLVAVPKDAEAKIVVGGCDVFAGHPIRELNCLVGVVRRLEQDVANAVADGAKLGGAVLGQLKDTLTCLKDSAASQVKEPGAAFTALATNAGTFLESLATEVWTSLVAKFREFVASDVAAATSGAGEGMVSVQSSNTPSARTVLDQVWARLKALAAGNTSLKCITDALQSSVTELRRRIPQIVSAMKEGLRDLYDTKVRPAVVAGFVNVIKKMLQDLAGPEGIVAAKTVVAGYMVNKDQIAATTRTIKDLASAMAARETNLDQKLNAARTELDRTFQFSSNLVIDIAAEILRLRSDALIAKYAPPTIEKLLKPLGDVTLFFASKISALCGVIPVIGGAICGSVVTGALAKAWDEIVKPMLVVFIHGGIVGAKDTVLNYAIAKLKERVGQPIDSRVDSALTALGPVGTEIRTVVNETVFALADNWVKPVANALNNYNQNVKTLAETAVERVKSGGGK